MKKIRIDLDAFEDKREFHRWLRDECNFPEYYGCNLDALYDCLTENNQFEFQILPSEKYEEYQACVVDAIIDAGCKVQFIFE